MLLFDWPETVNLKERKEDGGVCVCVWLLGTPHPNNMQLIKHTLGNTVHTSKCGRRLG